MEYRTLDSFNTEKKVDTVCYFNNSYSITIADSNLVFVALASGERTVVDIKVIRDSIDAVSNGNILVLNLGREILILNTSFKVIHILDYLLEHRIFLEDNIVKIKGDWCLDINEDGSYEQVEDRNIVRHFTNPILTVKETAIYDDNSKIDLPYLADRINQAFRKNNILILICNDIVEGGCHLLPYTLVYDINERRIIEKRMDPRGKQIHDLLVVKNTNSLDIYDPFTKERRVMIGAKSITTLNNDIAVIYDNRVVILTKSIPSIVNQFSDVNIITQ